MALAAGEAALGVYVHVPFCAHKCLYCDFTAYVYRADLAVGFAGDVLREAALLAELPAVRGCRGGTLYFGGGTPTVLPAGELASAAAGLRRTLGIGDGAEATVEANPETLDADELSRLRAAGFNRLSLGVQSWDDALLARLGRHHTAAEAEGAFRLARAAGFANVGIDLMYGIPGQTLAAWRETLARTVALGPEHVSAYSLQIEAGTPFGRRAREGRLRTKGSGGGAGLLPADDTVAEMYAQARDVLGAAGYEHYEISNFARPGFRSRHNQVYWRNGEYLGLGPGASSHLDGRRWTNARRLDRWRAALAAGALPAAEEERLGREREMSDTVILGLRLLEGVSLRDFRRRFDVDLPEVYGREIDELIGLGLLRLDGDRLRLAPEALPVANRVFLRFL